MKPRFYALLICIVFIACKKEPAPVLPGPSANHWGAADALQNGILWKANPLCSWQDSIEHTAFIHLDSFSTRWTEILSFSEVPCIPGTYEIRPSTWPEDGIPSAYFHYWNYDFAAATYTPLEGNGNRLVIESYDPVSREIKGLFDVVMVLQQWQGYPEAPDTIRFINGKFHGRLYK